MRLLRRSSWLLAVAVLGVAAPAFAAEGGMLPGESVIGRAEDEDPDAFLKRVKEDLGKVEASIAATKELLSRSKDSPILPDVSLRLAELYVEKSRLLYYKAVEERTSKGGEAITAPDAKYFKELAIEQYKKILKDFPAFPQNDKIRFFLAHEYQELAMTPEMLKEYGRLVQDYPDSPLVPEALLILGNFYFEKRDMDTAERYYNEVLKKSDAGLAALARYKMGWIEMNRAEHKKALANFEAAARSASEGAMSTTRATAVQKAKLKNVRREALTDSVQAFTEVKKPEEAVAFYGELADTRNLYAAILEKLGNRYYIQQNWEPSAKIYRTLVTLTHDVERSYEFGERFYECVAKSKKPQLFTAADAVALTETMARFSSSWRIPPNERAEGLKLYEVYVRDIATKLQVFAQNEKDPTRKKALAAEAGRAYAGYLSFFKSAAERPAMEENYAEALAMAGKHWEAARQYEKVARLRKEKEKDIVTNALAEWRQANAERDRLGRFRRVQAREGEKRLGEYFAQLYPDAKEIPSVKFNIARSYYDAGDYAKAISLFRGYVREFPNTKEAYAAANLVLDGYAQQEDFEGLSAAAKAMSTDADLPAPTFRKQVAEIGKQADFRRVGTLLAEGDGGEDPADKLARLAESSAGSELGEKALYTLFVTNRDRGERDKIFDAGERFLARYPQSEFASEILQSIGKLAIDTVDFARAAAYYERFAKARPQDKGSATLLERAATIREKMGDANRAAVNYLALPRLPGGMPASDAAMRSVVSYESIGDWPKAAEAARRLIQAGGDGPYAQFVIGYAAMKSGRGGEAKQYFQAAVGKPPRTSEDREAAAHAAFLLAEETKRAFDQVQFASAEDTAAIERKLGLLQALEAQEAQVVQIGSADWAVAALYRVGQGYRALADFLRNAPAPAGLSPAEKQQYAALLAEKAAPFDAKGKQSLIACVNKANELKVYSPWVAACAAGGGREPPLDQQPPAPRGGRVRPPNDLLQQLVKDPLNADTITRIASGYLNNGDPYTAELVARRAVEVDDSKAEAHTVLALALLRRGEINEAGEHFEKAAERAPGKAREWVNLASHQYAYGDPRKAVESLKRAQNPRSADPRANDSHPFAGRLLQDAPRLMSMRQ